MNFKEIEKLEKIPLNNQFKKDKSINYIYYFEEYFCKYIYRCLYSFKSKNKNKNKKKYMHHQKFIIINKNKYIDQDLNHESNLNKYFDQQNIEYNYLSNNN